MGSQLSVIFVSQSVWRTACACGPEVKLQEVPCPELATPENWARSLQQQLESAALKCSEVVLAIPSNWCMAAALDIEPLGRRNLTAALFALEEKLPIAAEEVSADFIWAEKTAFGVCVARSRVTPVIQALESCRISVAAVCPAPLLALGELQSCDGDGDANQHDLLLWREEDQATILRMDAEHVLSWHLAPCKPEDVISLLRVLALQHGQAPLRLLATDLPAEVAEAIGSLPEIAMLPRRESEVDLYQAAGRAAEGILAGRTRPIVNLHPDARRRSSSRRLRRPALAAVLSLGLLLLSLSAAMLMASWRMDRKAAALQQEQTQLFHQVVANTRQRAPRQIARYLLSEYQRLSTGQDPAAEAARAGSALQMLADIFRRTPSSIPLQLSRLRVEGAQAELVGHVASHDDAARLASALSGDGVLLARPPQTTVAKDREVSFTLQVQRPASNAPERNQP